MPCSESAVWGYLVIRWKWIRELSWNKLTECIMHSFQAAELMFGRFGLTFLTKNKLCWWPSLRKKTCTDLISNLITVSSKDIDIFLKTLMFYSAVLVWVHFSNMQWMQKCQFWRKQCKSVSFELYLTFLQTICCLMWEATRRISTSKSEVIVSTVASQQ